MVHSDFNITDVSAPGVGRSLIYVGRVQGWLDELGSRPEDVHKSIFRYNEEIRTYARSNGGSTRNFRGKAYADYIPVEIDGETLAESAEVAERVIEVVMRTLEIPDDGFSVFYSGNRGFHILLPTGLFGYTEPSEDFHSFMSDVVLTLLEDTDLVNYQSEHDNWTSSAIDLQVYSPQHMLRCPNTIHEKSSLFKVQVSPDMLSRPEEVRDRAASQRPIVSPESYTSLPAVDLGDEARGRLRDGESKTSAKVATFDTQAMLASAKERAQSGPGMGRYAARQKRYLDILKAGMVDGERRGGHKGRRRCLLALAGHFKYLGMPRDEATAILRLWNEANKEPLDDERFYETIKYTYSS